jgi:hypothetical protein
MEGDEMSLVPSSFKTSQFFHTVREKHADKPVEDFCQDIGVTPQAIVAREAEHGSRVQKGELFTLDLNGQTCLVRS